MSSPLVRQIGRPSVSCRTGHSRSTRRRIRFLWLFTTGAYRATSLYRVSRERATVVHLCVDDEQRGLGVARGLIQKLFDVTAGLRGVDLRCRQDYPANAAWPKLGFYHVESRPGRSREGHLLDRWWFDHGATDLFSLVEDGRLDVALDANVFFDIAVNDGGRQDASESMALMADWLEPHIRLFLSPEIFNEARRNPTNEGAEATRRAARGFPTLTFDGAAFHRAQRSASEIVPPRENSRDRDLSDLNHLAAAAAGEAKYFVTRDERLLEHVEEIERDLRVTVLRPVELILRLDDLHSSAGPEPVWLSGSKLEVYIVRDYDEADLSATFYSTAIGEKKVSFLRRVRTFLASPDRFQTEVVTGDSQALALIVVDRSEADLLRIPMLRVSDHRGASAVAQSLLFRAVKAAVAEGRTFVVVDETLLSPSVSEWLSLWGFVEDGGRFVKLAVPLVAGRDRVLHRLREVSETGRHPYVVGMVADALAHAHPTDRTVLGDIERLLWPCKLLGEGIPTFVVPIRPEWALSLFDERLADQTLFGAPRHLALSRKGAYYRARLPDPGLMAPGRILWYVSKGDGRYPGAGALRACSVIDRVCVSTPGKLYKQNARLGTYRWDDVFAVAKEDPSREIMAIQFSDTELFDRPIPWSRLRDLLPENAARSRLVSPVRVSSEHFETLYTTARPFSHRGSPRRTDRPHVDPTPLRRPHL